MMYELTKDYVCDYCGKKQTKDEQVSVLVGSYLRFNGGKLKYACKDCIKKRLIPGWSV